MQAKIIPINEKEPSRHFFLLESESEQAKQTFRKEKHFNFLSLNQTHHN